MKIPKRLQSLARDGLIDGVVGQLKSGKEADVYIVLCGDQQRCAKVFKEANKRGFKQAVQYQEGRKVKNTRRARAMRKRTRYGKREQEESWLNAEVQALYTLAAAGVRVPRPLAFDEGVLLMELITNTDGSVAPRLDSIDLPAGQARIYHDCIIAEVVRMLNAGLIHGDLSEFNVLVDAHGPVIIDLPQAVNAAANNSAGMMLVRDVDRMRDWFGRFAPDLLGTDYGKEIWALYARGDLSEQTELTGEYHPEHNDIDLQELMDIIDAAREEEEQRIARVRAYELEE